MNGALNTTKAINALVQEIHSKLNTGMKTLHLDSFGVQALSSEQLHNIAGGSIIGDIGYACGFIVGCATNAAAKLNTIIVEGLLAKGLKL